MKFEEILIDKTKQSLSIQIKKLIIIYKILF